MRALRFISVPFAAFGMFVMMSMVIPPPSHAQISIGVSVRIGPPPLPVYEQPLCPGDGYIWTPGYWAYGPDGYYWVPGTWVQPPEEDLLWTPGYWGWGDDAYIWHEGYWGPHVGFYGGIDYGFGYIGEGYVGGRWDHGRFAYNTAMNNVNVTIVHNTYIDRTVVRNGGNGNRVSFNGGHGGINARPTSQDQGAERERHFHATGNQIQHEQAARNDHGQLASVNRGQPAIAATPRPGAFSGGAVVRSKGAGTPERGGPSFRPPTAATPEGNRGRGDAPAYNSSRPPAGEAPAYRPPATQPPGGNHAGGGTPAIDSSRPSGGRPTSQPPPGGNHANTGAPVQNSVPRGNGGTPDRGNVQRNNQGGGQTGQSGGQHGNGGAPPSENHANAPQPSNARPNNAPQGGEQHPQGRGDRRER